MRRIWGAVAAAAACALVVGVVAGLAASGPNLDVRHRTMMGDWASDSSTGPGRASGCLRASGPGVIAVAREYEYLTRMVAHHEEAIAAAEQLSRSDRSSLREFGSSIVSSQSAQVTTMNNWLAEWYGDRPTSPSDYQPEMRDLTNLSGDQLDRALLVDMIGHHMMAVMQSQHLLALGLVEHEEVGVLATTIRDEQRAEISQMARWLRRWYPEQRPCSPVMPGSR